MSRWAPGAAGRLHAAAVELFVQHGFAATTVPQIAERAGLTTRSFFRYYIDKREVLFAGESELPGVVEQIFGEAEPGLSPLEAIQIGLSTVVVPGLQLSREDLLVRRAIIESDEGLRERELRKLTILQTAATAAFRRRGLSPLEADLAGRLAVTIYDAAVEAWLDQTSGESLEKILSDVVSAVSRTMARPESIGAGRGGSSSP